MIKDNPKKFLSILLIVFIVLILSGYALFQAKNLISGPILTITEPRDGETVGYNVVDIKGTARNIASITLNDGPIYVDSAGAFAEKLIVTSGYSIIKLSVADRFGRKKTTLLQLVYNTEDERIEMPTATTTQKMATTSPASTSPLITTP